jgi:hypothetical protein
MHTTCQSCGGQALPLLRADDVIEHVCVSCGAVTATPIKLVRDREMMPHQPKNWERGKDNATSGAPLGSRSKATREIRRKRLALGVAGDGRGFTFS